MNFKKLLLILLLLLFSATFSHVSAQTITTIQDIDFGQAVITNNNAQYQIVINPNGSYTADPEFSFVTTPSEGIYLLSGAPARQRIDNIIITVDQQMNGTGEDFIIDSFNVRNNPQTNNAGELTVELGARLRTSGSGINYTAETSFNAIMTMDIIY